MNKVFDTIGRAIAGYLGKPEAGYEPFAPGDLIALQATLKPADVLLVEGNTHISGVIKYLTQSTWSHAALYTGSLDNTAHAGAHALTLVEADISRGVIAAPLSKYSQSHTRICRPIGLSDQHCREVCNYAVSRIGFSYDLKNIFDLVRYLVPLPVPQRWRRTMIALGSGDPTKLICSGMIAEAFQSVRYPILPEIARAGSHYSEQEIMKIRHSSLFVPRDFDISPYFAVVKPTIERGFDYRQFRWADRSRLWGHKSPNHRAR
ncbi:MAG: lipo-like protein [Variibacter sp.]